MREVGLFAEDGRVFMTSIRHVMYQYVRAEGIFTVSHGNRDAEVINSSDVHLISI